MSDEGKKTHPERSGVTTDTISPPVFRLSLLGGFALTGPDGPVDLPSKKLAGLLAYLALVGSDPQSRERLVTLFWGSHFEAQARQNLRKALSRLRRVLGQDAFVSVREAIALAPGVVACDAVRLQRLIRDGGRDSLAEAASLYKGPLLSAVSITEDAWTEWLDVQRRHIENLALDAMVSLGEQELKAGNHEGALAAASRAVAINELREDAHRVIVQTLAAAGRKAEALKHFQDLGALLKRELNTEPDMATREVIGAIGARPAAKPQNVDEAAKPAAPEPDHLLAAADVMIEPRHGITSVNPAAPVGSSPERRQLTVMVCNLVGSAPHSVPLDPEELRDRVALFHKTVADVAAQFEGFIAQYSSDGVVVYFGYPSANEHDAEQAVRAGLAIIDSIRKLKTFGEEPFQARAGIATGQVVVGEQPGTADARQRVAIGEAPNLAAQLQAAAAPGQILIAASTRHLVGRMFDCRELSGSELRGPLSTVEAWHVRDEVVGVSRFHARRTGELAPLVGRQEEMELLLRRWEQAKLGEGRVVLLSGEPGIGKSRLAESLLHSVADEPHARLHYFCSPHYTHSPLYPFIVQLERAARFEPGDSVEKRLDKIEALLKPAARNVPQDLALVAELLGVPLHGSYPAVDVSPQQKREMTLSTLLDQFDGLTALSPALVVVEDIHWMDPTSLDLLDRMIARASDRPVLLIVTFRPELQPSWIGQPGVTMLALNRLGRGERTVLAMQVARGKALPDEVLAKIADRADGVPLFVEELTRSVLESGVLREEPDRYVLDRALPQLAIPMTLNASLLARLDRLASARHVAQVGAALGREFSYEVLAAVADRPDKQLHGALDELVESGLAFRRGVPPGASFIFKHALVQDAAYGMLLQSQRQELHARIVNVLEDQFPEIAASQPESLAHHCAGARLIEPAIGYWQKAGERSLQSAAMTEAVKHLTSALNLIPSLPASPGRDRKERGLCLALARATYSVRGPGSETLRLFSRANDLLDESASSDEWISVLTGLWRIESNRAHLVAAHELARQSVAIAVDRRDSEALGRTNLSSGVTLCWMGMFTEARDCLEQALDWYARIGEIKTTAALFGAGNAQSILGLTLWLLGCPSQAVRSSMEGLIIARESGFAAAVSIALVNLALLETVMASPSAADAAHVDEAAAHCARHYPVYEPWARFYSGSLKCHRGDPQRGIEIMKAAVADEEEFDLALGRTLRLGYLAAAHAKLGELEVALGVLDEAVAIVEMAQERLFEAEIHRLRGEVLLGLRMTEDAEAALLRALTVARNQGACMWELRASMSLARLWKSQGQNAEARELLAAIYDWFTEGFDTADLQEARALLAELR